MALDWSERSEWTGVPVAGYSPVRVFELMAIASGAHRAKGSAVLLTGIKEQIDAVYVSAGRFVRTKGGSKVAQG